MFEQDKHNDEDDEIEERPIGANSEEWKADRKVHREVSNQLKKYRRKRAKFYPRQRSLHLGTQKKKRDGQRSPQFGAPRKGVS